MQLLWNSFIILVLFFFTTSKADLFNSSDPLIILNNENFYETVLNKENAWVIEFYLSWCGHCINFAPTWREFSADIIEWQHTIKVGVIDCADEENIPICKNYGVKRYPHIRLLSSNANQDTMGDIINSRQVDELKEDVIDFLQFQQENQTGSHTWVNLLRYRNSFNDLFDEISSDIESAVIIIEPEESKEGSSTVMDLGSYPNIYVRTMTVSDAQEEGFEPQFIPTILIINRNGKQTTLTENFDTGKDMTNLILAYFKIPRKMYYFNVTSDGTKDDQQLFTAVSDNIQVYMVDLENALSYMINQEIMLHQTLTGESLDALKDFLDILVRYFPARPKVAVFLEKLRNSVNRHRNSLDSVSFENYVTKLNNENSSLPAMRSWIGCLGSEEKYRGYPCSLWVLFHTLTVNAVLKDKDNPSYDPKHTLKAIHGYVKYFFGCKHCSEHFQAMYKLDAETFIQHPNDEVLWLWEAHNKVNIRLKDDLSEDPKHEKQLFPPKYNCPSCWADGNFVKAEVLKYLKRLYSKDFISLIGIDLFTSSKSVSSSSDTFVPSFWLPLSSYLIADIIYIFKTIY